MILASQATTATSLNLFRVVSSMIVIGLTVLALFLIWHFFKRYKNPSDPKMKQRKTWMMVIYSLLRFFVIVCAVLILLDLFGVDVKGAIAGLGIAGAAAALAIQDLLKDLIMGVTIVSDHFFSLGDVLKIDDANVKVIELTMRSTKVESLVDGSIRTISNHLLTDVTVLSHPVTLNIPLPYDLPVSEAAAVLDRICARSEKDIETVEKCLNKGANIFNDSSISYLLIFYCDPTTYYNTRRAVIRVVQEELEAAGIQIPFPQIDVHTK